MPIASRSRKSGRLRHIPQRTCVGCHTARPKRELVRVVRAVTGAVEVDHTGKKSGRGAYLCKNRGCWQAALARERLDRALRTRISAGDREALASYAETLPQSSEE